MDAPSKEKLLHERREYQKARAAENKQGSFPALAQQKQVLENNDIEFDSALFEPEDQGSDDEDHLGDIEEDEGWDIEETLGYFLTILMHTEHNEASNRLQSSLLFLVWAIRIFSQYLSWLTTHAYQEESYAIA